MEKKKLFIGICGLYFHGLCQILDRLQDKKCDIEITQLNADVARSELIDRQVGLLISNQPDDTIEINGKHISVFYARINPL